MAKVTLYAGFNMRSISFGEIFGGALTNTDTMLRFDSGGNRYFFNGFDIEYDGDTSSVLQGGTIERFSIWSGSDVQVRITGFEIAATDLRDVASTGEHSDDWLLLSEALQFADTLTGSNSVDSLYGFGGDDVLHGNRGNDRLNGGKGDDMLLGGDGIDYLTGGAGDDSFILKSRVLLANRDAISDFANRAGNNDTLLLDNAVMASLGAAGALDESMFLVAPKALDGNDHLVYDRQNGKLYYDADGVGGADHTLIATFSNKALLSAADFIVI